MFILPQKAGEEGAQGGGVAVEVGYTEANLEKNLRGKVEKIQHVDITSTGAKNAYHVTTGLLEKTLQYIPTFKKS